MSRPPTSPTDFTLPLKKRPLNPVSEEGDASALVQPPPISESPCHNNPFRPWSTPDEAATYVDSLLTGTLPIAHLPLCMILHPIFYRLATGGPNNMTASPLPTSPADTTDATRTPVQDHSKKVFQCNECGRLFTRQYNLVRHCRHLHSGMKTFTCDICGDTFKHHSTLEHHQESHMSERPRLRSRCREQRGNPPEAGRTRATRGNAPARSPQSTCDDTPAQAEGTRS